MKIPATPLLATALLTLAGCAHSVTTAPYQPDGANTGITYALPRTRLDVALIYTVVKTTKMKDGQPDGAPTTSVKITKPATVTPVLVADEDNMFIISGDGLAKDGHLDASFKFAVDDNQLLTSVSAEVTDKTPEIFQSVVGAAVSYAKFIAVAGETKAKSEPEEEKYTKRMLEIDQQMLTLSTGGDKNRLAEMKNLKAERSLLVESLALYQAANTPVVTEKDIPYSQIIPVADLINGSVTIQAPPTLFGLKKDDNRVPAVTVTLAANAIQKTNAVKKLFKDATAKELDGVYFRLPSRAPLKITQEDTVLFDATLPFAQLGQINKVDAGYKFWAKRKTSVTFSKTSGSISEYGVDTTSSVEAAAKAVDTSFSKVEGAAADLKKAKDDADAKKKTPEDLELADLQQKQKIAEARLAIVKAQKALVTEQSDPSAGTGQ